MLESKIKLEHNAARVDYKGNTIHVSYGPLPEIVELVEKHVNKILINLSDVDYFTSAGISTLLATAKIAKENDVAISIYNLQSQVQDTIQRTGLRSIIPCFDSEEDAAEHIGISMDSSLLLLHK